MIFGVLNVNGCPAGFVELDGRNLGEVEIVHLGVMPEHSRRYFPPFFFFSFLHFYSFSFFFPRESAYLKVLVEFAVAASFSQSDCGRLFAKESSGK